MVTLVSSVEARRIALAAQGFCDPPHQAPTMRTLDRTVERTGVLQVDSVNILARAHYMPLYSRMGPYPTDLLHRAASGQQQRRLVEYWAHVQALMPVETWPLMQHRMGAYRRDGDRWDLAAAQPGLSRRLLDVIEDGGAITAKSVPDNGPKPTDHWGWNWSAARKMLNHLFLAGEVAMAGRTSSFEPLYDLPERVIPTEVLSRPVPEEGDAVRELVGMAARSHGVATAADLADYYRMNLGPTQVAVSELVEEGTLVAVEVQGWNAPAYLHCDARRVRSVRARTLLSPFDPMVWRRDRALRLFDFHYRIEIYTPALQRTYGYYVLPFLLGDELVARVDLKADRKASVLRVLGAFAEPGAPAETAAELAVELHRMAEWTGCHKVTLGSDGTTARGDLVAELAAESVADS